MRDLRLVPDRAVGTVAAAVVAAEVAVVVSLAVPGAVAVGLALAGVLLAVFTVSILITLRRGVRAACRCFGTADLPLGRRHVTRNSALLAVVALGGLGHAVSPTPLQPAGAVLAAVVGLVGAALLVVFDEIVELFVDPTPSTDH